MTDRGREQDLVPWERERRGGERDRERERERKRERERERETERGEQRGACCNLELFKSILKDVYK